MRQLEARKEKQDNRMTLTLFLIFVFFILCTVPPTVLVALDSGARKYPSIHIPIYVFGWGFGFINPVLYFALNQSYRDEFKVIFLCNKR